jgi:DNA-binding response OmpR family regulator
MISADWQFRALVRAQLVEEGYDVQAFPAWQVALAYLQHGTPRPALTIIDTQDLRIEPHTVSRLWQLTREAPLLLCGDLLDRGLLDQEGMPPAHLLVRPFRVGDVVAEVRRMGIWPQADLAEE